jgi:hypothetical protein
MEELMMNPSSMNLDNSNPNSNPDEQTDQIRYKIWIGEYDGISGDDVVVSHEYDGNAEWYIISGVDEIEDVYSLQSLDLSRLEEWSSVNLDAGKVPNYEVIFDNLGGDRGILDMLLVMPVPNEEGYFRWSYFRDTGVLYFDELQDLTDNHVDKYDWEGPSSNIDSVMEKIRSEEYPTRKYYGGNLKPEMR